MAQSSQTSADGKAFNIGHWNQEITKAGWQCSLISFILWTYGRDRFLFSRAGTSRAVRIERRCRFVQLVPETGRLRAHRLNSTQLIFPRPDKQVTLKRWILWELSSGKQLPAWILGFTTFHRSVSHFSPVFSTIESHWTKVNPAWANGPERTYFTELLSLSIVCLKFTRAWTCLVGGVERTG